ncbi:Endoplasmic oxidoreductin-2 [Hordeum vulgare]|nr:Endoplasmic oxidoreductin-2 [Hordeum vulgare]
MAGRDGHQNHARDVRGARPRGGRRGRTPVTALLMALLAVVVHSRSFPSISSLSHDGGCGCPVRLPLGLVILGSSSGEVLIRRRCFVQGATRKYTGMVENCYCNYETADAINEEVLNPILQDLVALPFFMYFKVK